MKELVIAKTDGTLLKRPKAEKKGHGYLEMERELEEFRRVRMRREKESSKKTQVCVRERLE
eukprot:87312-Amorphochlora_amoeboformis.AAC.1